MSNEGRFTWEKGGMALVDPHTADAKYLMHLVSGNEVAQEVAQWLQTNPADEDIKQLIAQLEQKSAALSTDAEGHQHKGKGPGGGQFTSSGGGSKEGDSGGGKTTHPGGKVGTTPTIEDVIAGVVKHSGYTKEQLAKGLHTDPVMRAKITSGILTHNRQIRNAVLHVERGDVKRLEDITTGDTAAPLKEFKDIPACDLAVLTHLTVKSTPVHGEAVANMGSRAITTGTTTRPGSYRHELGHVLRAALGGENYSNKTDVTKAISHEYDLVMQRVKANPIGLKTKQSYDWYEENYGVIGRRALDNWEENFAEHYRGYHRALYRDAEEGGNGMHIARYHKLHPGMAKIFDAHYTTALIAQTLAQGGAK